MSQPVDPLIDLYSFQTFKRLIPWPENCGVLYNFYVYYLGRRRFGFSCGRLLWEEF
jgi:hypothetical protein